MSWNEGIDGPGLEFAASTAAKTRCLAGPGTGKTFALMRRVQRLIQAEGVSPERILVLTLTRTAADDLRRSLHDLHVNGADSVVTSTLHSFCFSALLGEEVLQATGRTPRLIADFERDILLRDLPDSLGTFSDRTELLKQFQAAWSALDGSPLGHAPGTLPGEFQDALIKSMKWHQCMLVGELVPIAKSYLEENPYSSVLEQFDHVLVDEYQDLNRADHGVIELLSVAAIRRGGEISIIGDDDQCIYVGLRHAHPRGIVEYTADVDVPLVECRRCPTRITAMAQSLISHNPGRAKPPLQPRPSNPPGVLHNVMFRTMEEEAEGLAQFIHSRIESGQVEPGEVLVLANWRVIAYQIRDRLVELGHDAHSYFREEPLDTAEARRVLTLLSLVANPEDRTSLRAYLALSNPSELRAGYRRVQEYANQNGLSAADVLELLASGGLQIPYTRKVVEAFESLVGFLKELEPLQSDLHALVDVVCPAGEPTTHALRQTIDRTLLDGEMDGSIGDFVSTLRTQIGAPEVPLDASFVRLMSLHKSKGLTVKLVAIAGLVDGLVPRSAAATVHGNALEEHEQEQRRILYVGITRPTAELVLSRFQEIDTRSAHISRAATGRWVGRGLKRAITSSLLRELGQELPTVMRSEDWVY